MFLWIRGPFQFLLFLILFFLDIAPLQWLEKRKEKLLKESRVHISLDEVFSKILKKPSIPQKKRCMIWKPLVFLIRWFLNTQKKRIKNTNRYVWNLSKKKWAWFFWISIFFIKKNSQGRKYVREKQNKKPTTANLASNVLRKYYACRG